MRKIALTIFVLFSTSRLFALGLGNIELNSALNQPFDARIELLSPTSAEIDTLSIRLADLEAFNRAGIERVFILTSLQFEIEINDAGPDYIRISSSEAIREPYLNFLLEASWSSGRLFREYTVLLDPPLYDPNTRRMAVPSTPVSEPAPVTTSQSQSSSPASISSFSGNEYGPIGANETLWSIATQVRPDSGVTIQQMMLALLRANPEAFIESNINGLRQGQILRIPDRNEITGTSAEAAISQVQSQNSLWEEVRGTFAANASQRPTGGAPQPTDTSDSSDTESAGSELRLVSPGSDSTDSGQAVASFDSTGQGSADLAIANEQLEVLSAENNDLRNRLEDSETLIQDLQRLLELRDDELATLQQQTAGGAVIDETSDAIQDQMDSSSEVIEEEMDVEVVPEEITSLALDETEQPAEPPVDVTSPSSQETSIPPAVSTQPDVIPAESSLVDQVLRFIFANLMLVGGALGALIIAIAALFFIKKRKESALDDEEELTAAGLPDFEGTAEETAMPEEESEMDSEIDASDEDAADKKTAFIGDEESQQLSEEIEETPVAEESVEEAAPPAEEPEDDPLAEVNVFLAYEHFDQAEEFVRDAIQGDPNNLDFHSKLLEIFYSAGDKVKYEEEAKVVQELTGGEGPHWEMATIMWQEISPTRELFAEPIDGEDEASEEAKGGGIVDLTADEEGGENEDDGLDFDLGSGDAEQSAKQDESGDDGMLDITSGDGDDVLDVTADSGEEDLLDVTAAVGLDDVEKAADSEDENVLDISGDFQPEEDVLDISAAPGGDEDLLDVTAHTELEAEGDEDLLDVTAATSEIDMESTMKIPADSSKEDDALDFDIGGEESSEESADSSGDDNVIDFDAATSKTPAEEEEGLDISLDGSENDGDIELDLGEDLGSDSAEEVDEGSEISLDDSGGDGGIELDMSDDSGSAGDGDLEISLDDSGGDGGIELDMSDDSGSAGDGDLEISLDDSGGDGGIELDMSDDSGSAGDGDLEISLDDSGDDGGIELDMSDDSAGDANEITLDDDDDDDDDDEEDHTVFVPRTADASEQSAEDEIATKLDLAKAYVELGDGDSAKTILDEVIADGNEEQKRQAEELKAQVS